LVHTDTVVVLGPLILQTWDLNTGDWICFTMSGIRTRLKKGDRMRIRTTIMGL
jgi:hypothetical protein